MWMHATRALARLSAGRSGASLSGSRLRHRRHLRRRLPVRPHRRTAPATHASSSTALGRPAVASAYHCTLLALLCFAADTARPLLSTGRARRASKRASAISWLRAALRKGIGMPSSRRSATQTLSDPVNGECKSGRTFEHLNDFRVRAMEVASRTLARTLSEPPRPRSIGCAERHSRSPPHSCCVRTLKVARGRRPGRCSCGSVGAATSRCTSSHRASRAPRRRGWWIR